MIGQMNGASPEEQAELESYISAGKAIPEITLTINGKKETLQWTLYGFCRLHEETGKNLLDGSAFNTAQPMDLAQLIWAGLVTEHRDMSVEDVARQVNVLEIGTQILPLLIQHGISKAQISESQKKSTSKKRGRPRKNRT